MGFDFSSLTEEQAMDMMYPKQLEAYKACRFGTGNVLVTAAGGFGKSFIIEALMHYDKGGTIGTGTTGVAASGIGGATTHSTLGMPLGIPTKQSLSKTTKRYKSLFKRNHNVRNIIIDEVSMMGPETMDSLTQRLERISRSAKAKKVRCLLFGDFFQLLNVVNYKERPLIIKNYGTTKLLESTQFKNLRLDVYELDQNKRVGDDKVFIDRLEDIRNGRNLKEALEYFNKQVGTPDPESVLITTTNSLVDRVNKEVFDANTNIPYSFSATISGDFNVKDSRLEERLVLKQGLRVMSLANDSSGEDRFVNGSIGTVTFLMENTVEVTFDNGNVVWVEPTEEENTEYYTDDLGDLCTRVIGSMTGIALRQCSAITANKSQGIGLDKATIDLSEGAFSAGQVYVMLSRMTNIKGLTLTTEIKETDIIVDNSVKKFYAELRGEVLPEDIPEGYEKYKIRLIVAGGRTFRDFNYMTKSLDYMLKNYSSDEILIISGTAEGADKLGEQYASLRGIDVERFPANWKDITTPPVKIKSNSYGEYNVLAGMVRNKKMGNFGTHLVAYWDGSKGTSQMIDYMKDLSKPVKIFNY